MAAELTKSLDAFERDSWQNEEERYQLKEAARRLLARVETPFEQLWSGVYEKSALVSSAQVCLDLGLFPKWRAVHQESGGAPQTLDRLLSMCNKKLEPNLLRRFLRHLAAQLFIEETGPDEWKLMPMSLALGDQGDDSHTAGLVTFAVDHIIPTYMNIPKFLAEYDYVEPLDLEKLDCHRYTKGEPLWDYCQKHPSSYASFMGMMTGVRNNKMDWTEVYDTKRITEGVVDDDGSAPTTLFVDVGGCHGLDSARLLTKHPELPASVQLYVEDLPEVVFDEAHGNADGRIQKLAYDFFTPQPIAGSRAYFLHAVLHDWPDEVCLKILANVKAAMKEGHSRLLIYEMVIPPQGATSFMTTLDLGLMGCNSGLERTEDMWKSLIGQAGFRVTGIWRHARAVESVIEAEIL